MRDTVDRGLRESRYLEGTHRFYRFRTPLRGRTHHLYRAAPFLLKRCNRNVTKKNVTDKGEWLLLESAPAAEAAAAAAAEA